MRYCMSFNKLNVIEIFKAISAAKNFNEIKDIVIEALVTATSYEAVIVGFFGEAEDGFMQLISMNAETGDKFESTLSIDQIPALEREALTNPRSRSMRIKKGDFFNEEISRLTGMGEAAHIDVFPIKLYNKAEGFVACFKGDERGSADDFDFVLSTTSLMELFLENGRRNLRVENIIKRLKEAVNSMSRSLRQLYEYEGIDDFLSLAVRLLCDITRSKSSMIIIDDSVAEIQAMSRYGDELELLKVLESIAGSGSYGDIDEVRLFNEPDESWKQIDPDIKALAIYKLKKGDRIVGHIVAANAEEYLDEEKSILGIFASQILIGIEISLTSKEVIKHKILEKELEIVSEQQKLIMNNNSLDMSGRGEISFLHRTSQQVGGDFCKIFEMEDDRVGIFLADVMGHGLLSNYFSAMIKGALRILMQQENSTGAILSKINSMLYEDFDKTNVFATARAAIFDVRRNRIVSSNAGHLHPIGIRLEEGTAYAEEMNIEKGIPIGVLSDADYEECEYELGGYELVAYYTDGIIEAQNSKGEYYGVDRLKEFLKSSYTLGAEQIFRNFEEEIYDFAGKSSLDDDFILLLYKKSDERGEV